MPTTLPGKSGELPCQLNQSKGVAMVAYRMTPRMFTVSVEKVETTHCNGDYYCSAQGDFRIEIPGPDICTTAIFYTCKAHVADVLELATRNHDETQGMG